MTTRVATFGDGRTVTVREQEATRAVRVDLIGDAVKHTTSFSVVRSGFNHDDVLHAVEKDIREKTTGWSYDVHIPHVSVAEDGPERLHLIVTVERV